MNNSIVQNQSRIDKEADIALTVKWIERCKAAKEEIKNDLDNFSDIPVVVENLTICLATHEKGIATLEEKLEILKKELSLM